MEYPPTVAEQQGGDRASVGETGADGLRAAGQENDRVSGEMSKEAESPARAGPDAVARRLPGGGGVYLLTDQQDRLIQLSAAADLRHALRNRLLEPPIKTDEPLSAVARRRVKLGEIVRKIRWQPAHSAFEIDYTYLRIARQVMPDDYRNNLAFGPAWFVHVDPDSPIPRFVVTKVLGDEGVNLGPFPTQPDAHRFLEMLEDVFDLCRCYDSLGQAPRGTTCVYYEMGKCPAPCAGLIPMEQYRDMIRSALAFASGDREPALARWRQEMQALADQWAFERAAAVKQRTERAGIVEQPPFRLVRPIEQFNYLVVQRGRGRTRVNPFLVRGGWIAPGEPVALKRVAEAIPAWLSALRSGAAPTAEAGAGDRQHRSEQIWLVSHYLFKRNPPGLFLAAPELHNTEAIAGRIRERFGRAAGQTEAETS